MSKRVLVIGAGIAGLSAASYLQRNGFTTEIFELHDKPGGLCAAWKRNDYVFDGCIHWLMGSGASSNLHKIWEELGAGELDYVEHEVYEVARLSDGDSFSIYTDPDRLKAEILRLGPEDEAFASLLCSKIESAAGADMPAAFDRLSFGEAAKLLLAMPAMASIFSKWMKVPLQSLVDGIEGPKLREAFSVLFGDALRDFPAGALFMMLGFMAKKSAGYPVGGSLAFARAIEAKYLALGGSIHYGQRVDEVVVEEGRAVGLKGSWGESRGDYVISAADGRDLLDRLLKGAYAGCSLDRAFSPLERYPSLLFMGFGLARDCSDLPHAQVFKLDESLVLEGGALKVERLMLRLFNFDPSLAPAGKTAATVMIETGNDEYWISLAARDGAAYAAAKREAAAAVIAALDRKLPGFSSWVEAVDVATPKTFIRYTNNWHGSYEGWLPTSKSFGSSLPRTIEGIENLELVGQWVNPGGGLPPCGIDGRRLAKRLCKKEGLRFRPE